MRKHKFISQSKNIMVLGLNTNLFILFFIYISIQILQSKFSMFLLSKQHSHIKTTLIICTWNAIKFSHFFIMCFFSHFLTFLLILFVHTQYSQNLMMMVVVQLHITHKKGIWCTFFVYEYATSKIWTILSLNVFKSVIKCLLYEECSLLPLVKSNPHTHTYTESKICDHKYNESHYTTIFQL